MQIVNKKWREQNSEQSKIHSEHSYQKHRNQRLARMKENYPKYKDVILQAGKNYYEHNK